MNKIERAHFRHCFKALMHHLEELRPILGEKTLTTSTINAARELVRTFLLTHTGPETDQFLFVYGKREDIFAARSDGLWFSPIASYPPQVVENTKRLLENETLLSAEQYLAMCELLGSLVRFAQDGLPTSKRRTGAEQLRASASDFVELRTGQPWESNAVEIITAKEWLHDAGSEPPADFYRDKWLTDTQTRIGFAIRHEQYDPVDSDRAHRDYLSVQASAKRPRVWCRKAIRPKIDVFFREPKGLHDAEARLPKYTRHTPTEVGGSPRKSVPKKTR